MASVRFADTQSRPVEFLDCTSLTLDEFQPHSIGLSGGQLSSYVEGSSALDFPLIHDVWSQDPP
jgi:hypothetical protein